MNATHLLLKDYKAVGEFDCCLCSFPCGDEILAKDYFDKDYRGVTSLRNWGSDYICLACSNSLRSAPGDGVIKDVEGTVRAPKNVRIGNRYRTFSWVLEEGTEPLAATKAHIEILRNLLKNPPVNNYFAFVFSETGQKQLIYRLEAQKIQSKKDSFTVQYEEDQVTIDSSFWRLLDCADNIASLYGKKRLDEPVTFAITAKYLEVYSNLDGLRYWQRNFDTPESRLCAFLAVNRGKG